MHNAVPVMCRCSMFENEKKNEQRKMKFSWVHPQLISDSPFNTPCGSKQDLSQAADHVRWHKLSHYQACVRLQESKKCQTAARVTEQFISESSFSQLLAKVPVISGTQGFMVSSQWFSTTCLSRSDQVMQSSGICRVIGLTHYGSNLLFNCDSHRPRLTVVIFTFITHFD